MPSSFADIGNFLGGSTGKSLLTAAGLGANIASGVQDWQQQSRYNSAQSYLNNLIQNPTAMAAAAQKYTQPLNQGLVTAVTNATNAQLGERGLGGSSAITQATLAQALAPYIQQNQQAGQNMLLSSLGMVNGLRPTGGSPMVDLSKILQSLKSGGAAPTNANDPYSLPVFGANAQPAQLPSPDLGTFALPTLPASIGTTPDLSALFQ